jgi:cytochrome c556
MKLATFLLAGIMLCGSVIAAHTVSAATPDEIIAARQANQKRVDELVKQVDTALKSNASASALVDQLTEIDQRAHLLKGYFPDGTQTGGNTKARPEIWTNRAGFDVIADRYAADFDKALTLARAGDTAGLTAQWAQATSNCGACHRDFRAH